MSVGGWSGTCTCPNGESYWVGDNYNACGSIACVNGVAGQCQRWNYTGKHRKVICHAAVECDAGIRESSRSYAADEYRIDDSWPYEKIEGGPEDCEKLCKNTEDCNAWTFGWVDED
eukprot:UN24213